jgi:hypothetical protein
MGQCPENPTICEPWKHAEFMKKQKIESNIIHVTIDPDGDEKQIECVPVELARNLQRELAEAKKQRDTLAEALDLSLSILIALMDGNEDVYDLIVTTTNKNTGEENKMSVREALEKSIAALAAVKGGSDE